MLKTEELTTFNLEKVTRNGAEWPHYFLCYATADDRYGPERLPITIKELISLRNRIDNFIEKERGTLYGRGSESDYLSTGWFNAETARLTRLERYEDMLPN